MSRLREVLIDDATWDEAPAPRRREWQIVIDDLLSEHSFALPGDEPLRLQVTNAPDRITLDLVQPSGRLLAHCAMPVAELISYLGEYVETCREMVARSIGDNSPRLEALDIAKRLIHDEGADALQLLCRVLRPDHVTARRLFTLIVALRYDTTRLGPLD